MCKSYSWTILFVLAAACDSPTGPLGVLEERMRDGHREVDVRWESFDGTQLVGTAFFPAGDGPFPTILAHFGSGEWSRPLWPFVRDAWLDRGWGILSYDKRGVGESGGVCCDLGGSGSIEHLALDVMSGVQMLRTISYVDPARVGLYGFSQGGWVVPLAARGLGDVAFTVIGSGPAVSVGEENLFSELTGDDDCRPTNLSATEIAREMANAKPSGFDPREDLRVMPNPGFWFYGGRDTSNPVDASVAVLQTMRDEHSRQYDWIVYESANHALIPDGEMCQGIGLRVDYWTAVFEWIGDRFGW